MKAKVRTLGGGAPNASTTHPLGLSASKHYGQRFPCAPETFTKRV